MATHLLRVRATFSFCLQVETHSTKNVRCLLALDFFSLEDQRGIGCQILPFCAPRRKKRIGRVAATRRGVPAHRSLVPVAEKAIDRRFIFSAGPKIVETKRAEIFVFFKKKKNRCLFSRWDVELPTTRRGALKVSSPHKSTSVSTFLGIFLKFKKISLDFLVLRQKLKKQSAEHACQNADVSHAPPPHGPSHWKFK